MPVLSQTDVKIALDPDSMGLPSSVRQASGEAVAVMAEQTPVVPSPPQMPELPAPYPPPVASCPCCDSTACTLLGLYAGPCSELTGVLQYLYDAMVFQKECPEASAIFDALALDEMKHLRLLGELLLSLGVCPRYTASPGWWNASPSVLSYETCLERAVCRAAEGETADAARYRRLAESLCDEGIAALFLRLAEDEEMHLEMLCGFAREKGWVQGA